MQQVAGQYFGKPDDESALSQSSFSVGLVSNARCCGCACGSGHVMPRKRFWAVHYRGRHTEQANCKKFCVAEDATSSHAQTRCSIPKYAMSGRWNVEVGVTTTEE